MNWRIAGALAGALALGGSVMADEFATRAEAMRYLATALAQATAENPKYTAKGDGTVSQWLTNEVLFATAATGAVEVTMRESYVQTRDGKTTPGKHEATFSLADVEITEFAAPYDLTPEGTPARGLLFACAKAGCVAALWSGKPSRADRSDIYIQDDAARARILAAFRRLQSE